LRFSLNNYNGRDLKSDRFRKNSDSRRDAHRECAGTHTHRADSLAGNRRGSGFRRISARRRVLQRPLDCARPHTLRDRTLRPRRGSDQALKLLSDPGRIERDVLGSIRYQANSAILHCDSRLMPGNRRAWASWNYRRLGPEAQRATLTYNLNQLQGIGSKTPVLVTLNQDDAIDPDLVFVRMQYDHPVLDLRAVAAQRKRSEINGRNRTWYCGAYWGYGFHEDGVRSAVDVCRAFGARL